MQYENCVLSIDEKIVMNIFLQQNFCKLCPCYTNYRNCDTQRMPNFALFRKSCASIAISRVPRKIDNTFLFDNADLIPPNPAQWYQLDYLPRCQCTPNVSCFTFNLRYISLSVKATLAQYFDPDKSDISIHFSQH